MSDSNDETTRPQFTLRGLLWFFVAASAYLSMIAETARQAASGWHQASLWYATVFMVWIILSFFLRSNGVRGMYIANYAGPVCGLIVSPFVITVRTEGPFGKVTALQILVAGCFASSLISFPASVLQMVVRGLWNTKLKQ